MKADEFLLHAAGILKDRGKARDSEEGERSFDLAAKLYNQLTGEEMTAEGIIRVMMSVKLARMAHGVYHEDDYVDLIGYTALLLEELSEP